MNKKNELLEIPHEILKEAEKAGIEKQNEKRSGTFFHVNEETIYSKINQAFEGKLELLDIKVALKKYPWLEEYMWKIIKKDKNEYTKKVADNFSGGYFMRIMAGAELNFPLQSCLMITQKNLEQKIHNIIIAEENSKANIITSCLEHTDSSDSSHLGVSEIFLKKGATLNFTMIHQWEENTFVRPVSAIEIEDNATFISNYICTRPVKDVQMYPSAYCKGKESRVIFNSILYGNPNSQLDIGSRAVLSGKASKAEMVSRAVAREGGKMIIRGMIEGENCEGKGHLECRGLLLDNKSILQSIPELIAKKKGVEITHEAAVGKISEKEIAYLMTRKLTQDQAISLIIRGFMDVSILGLPKTLNDEIMEIVNASTQAL